MAEECQIFHRAIHSGSIHDAARVESWCQTHNMPVTPSPEADFRCPLGRIAVAIEEGLAKIAAAMKKDAT